jgi:hypothetical protein
MNEHAQKILDDIIDRFKTGNVPEAIALSVFPIADIPCAKWSLLNRTIMFFNGTADARGFKQWIAAGRSVKKGSKAFRILVPKIRTVEDKKSGEEKTILTGFMTGAVFRVENTDGKALDYENMEMPQLPLMKRAEDWGISIKAVPGNFVYRGRYNGPKNEILLASDEECVFFKELANAAYDKAKGQKQGPLKGIITDLAAQVLCSMVGKSNDTLGNSYKDIKAKADQLGLSPHKACLSVMSDTDRVLKTIMEDEK